MNRRNFLSTLVGAGAALAFDPERLLWMPGAKTIFVPKPYVPTVYIDVFSGLIGICNGIPIPLKAVNQATMGPLFEDGGSVYRLVELNPSTRINWNDSTIVAVPGGKLQVMVRGPYPIKGPIKFNQPGGVWL